MNTKPVSEVSKEKGLSSFELLTMELGHEIEAFLEKSGTGWFLKRRKRFARFLEKTEVYL